LKLGRITGFRILVRGCPIKEDEPDTPNYGIVTKAGNLAKLNLE
jgi:hypothetical protein